MEKDLNNILQQCRKSDREGQFKLFELFLPYVTSVCKRYLRDKSLLEDAVQEVFLLVFKGIIGTFDEKKGDFKSWLRRVTINCCLQFNKKYRGFEEFDTAPKVEKLIVQDTRALTDGELFQLLEAIPVGNRTVFNLYIIDGYDHQEIAGMLGISESSSRKKLQRARDFLKKIIETEDVLSIPFDNR